MGILAGRVAGARAAAGAGAGVRRARCRAAPAPAALGVGGDRALPRRVGCVRGASRVGGKVSAAARQPAVGAVGGGLVGAGAAPGDSRVGRDEAVAGAPARERLGNGLVGTGAAAREAGVGRPDQAGAGAAPARAVGAGLVGPAEAHGAAVPRRERRRRGERLAVCGARRLGGRPRRVGRVRRCERAAGALDNAAAGGAPLAGRAGGHRRHPAGVPPGARRRRAGARAAIDCAPNHLDVVGPAVAAAKARVFSIASSPRVYQALAAGPD